jgi:type VI secretion system secreted protein Hcp
MRDKQKRAMLLVGAMGLVAMVMLCISAGGGNLEPSSPPGPTMHTLEEVYNLVGSVCTGSGELTGPIAAAKKKKKAYMQAVGIPGESTDANHEGWIEVLGVNYSGEHPTPKTQSSVGGRIGRRVEFSDFTVVKEMDKASPKLHLYCCSGEHIPEVVIEFTMVEPVTSNTVVYHKVTLKEVAVLRFAPLMSHRMNGEYVHIEEVSLGYDEIHWEYTPYNAQGGAEEPVVEAWGRKEHSVPSETPD